MTMPMTQIDMSNGAAAYSGRTQFERALLERAVAASIGLGRLIGDAAATFAVWQSRRRAMRQLDDHMLRDIGLDRVAAEQTGARAFWKA